MNDLKPTITPHTYQVKEISFFEWASALVVYQQQKKGGASCK